MARKRNNVNPNNTSVKWIKRIFNKFCQSTSLHGYGFFDKYDSITLKTIWLFVIVVMTGLGMFFLWINTMEFMEKKITTNIESSSAPLSVRILFHILSLTVILVNE